MSRALSIITGLQKTGIEGLGGWGVAPGKVMTFKGDLLLPGITFGNIFIGPQPPRGWEINEELLHANLAFPPPHQYLAFYHFLRNQFKADALVHVGRHSTYEFLPRRSVGLAEDDYSRIVAGDLPSVYPYIVDGVGEGIQAKRRGLAVMVDHLTPPLASTPLYDELLQLRQLIESFEANHGSGNEVIAERLVAKIREKVDALELKEELAEAMSAELSVMGIGFEEVDDDMMVHEVGHYLTDLQERFMPLGLHIYGKDWEPEAVEMMLTSMLSKSDTLEASNEYRANLKVSPSSEMRALINGLNGGYISPGQGNDPIRSPASLPTGRNFYALDSSLIPSRVAWELGREMATSARSNNSQDADKSEALILWASDVVRDEGVMIAFGLDMLGIEPVWNSRGLVKGLKHQQLDSDFDRVRRDIVFTTSGLFRDLYGQQMLLLNQATLMALD
jgi:cobaltochelatase CobN